MKDYSLLHEEAKDHIDDLIKWTINGIFEDIAPIDGEECEEDEYKLFFEEGVRYFKEKVKEL